MTNRRVLRFGLDAAILFLPIVSAVGYFAIGITQVLEGYLFFTVICCAGEYAISKSAREVLFTVVRREEKYKGKNFIDTAVSRGDDALTGWAVSGMKRSGPLLHSYFGCWFRRCCSGDGSGVSRAL